MPEFDLDLAVATALQSSFLTGVPSPLVRELLHGSTVREIAAGRTFIVGGGAIRAGVVVSGLVRVFTMRPNGAQMTLARVGRGAAIGVRAIVGRHSQVNAQAITECEFLQLDPARILSLGSSHAELGWAVAQELDRRLNDTQLHVESNLTGSVRQRVASLLLDLSVDDQPLEVQATQEELAEMIGASREAVGREMRALREMGVIAGRPGRVVLSDAMRLQTIATDGSRARGLQPTTR